MKCLLLDVVGTETIIGWWGEHPSNALVLFQLCQSEGLVLLRYPQASSLDDD